jgi:hypothetical protein
VLVYATDAGRQVFIDMAAHRREVLSRVLAELKADEIAALLVGMRAIHAARRRILQPESEAATTAVDDPSPNGRSPDGDFSGRSSRLLHNPDQS